MFVFSKPKYLVWYHSMDMILSEFVQQGGGGRSYMYSFNFAELYSKTAVGSKPGI